MNRATDHHLVMAQIEGHMKKLEIVYLQITSWAGMSFGAEHYYGKLIGRNPEYHKVDIEKVMSEKERKALSKKDSFEWREGAKTYRFDTRDEIIALALASYKKHFPDAKCLILESSSTAEPQKILDAPKKIKEAGNALFAEIEKMEWIGQGTYHRSAKDEDRVDELTKAWMRLGL